MPPKILKETQEEKKQEEEVNLNFGCGREIIPGWKGYDVLPFPHAQFIDLNSLPLPFKNNVADNVRMRCVWEHLTCDHYALACDIHRILKPGGQWSLIIPSHANIILHTIPGINEFYFNAIVDNPRGFRTGVGEWHKKMFHIVKLRGPRFVQYLPLNMVHRWGRPWTFVLEKI